LIKPSNVRLGRTKKNLCKSKKKNQKRSAAAALA